MKDLMSRPWWMVRTVRATSTYPDEGPDFFEEGVVAVNFDPSIDLRAVPADISEIRAELAERVPDWRPGKVTMAARQLHQFANEMGIGDLVVTSTDDGRRASGGVIEGEYQWTDGRPRFRHTRSARWLVRDVDRHSLSPDTHRELSQRPTVFPLFVAPRELTRHVLP